MRAAVFGLIVAFFVGAATHAILLFGSPYWATDKQVKDWLSRGRTFNTLTFLPVPKVGVTTVPLANPDAFSSRAFIDLTKGPQILEGPIPPSCTYWSVSIFAHNTNTVLVKSDRDFPSGLVSIGVARRGENLMEKTNAIALLDSNLAVMILRCFMRDRNDAAYMAALDKERRKLVLRPANAGGRP
jgi:uncharacterized membrane protein